MADLLLGSRQLQFFSHCSAQIRFITLLPIVGRSHGRVSVVIYLGICVLTHCYCSRFQELRKTSHASRPFPDSVHFLVVISPAFPVSFLLNSSHPPFRLFISSRIF